LSQLWSGVALKYTFKLSSEPKKATDVSPFTTNPVACARSEKVKNAVASLGAPEKIGSDIPSTSEK
jgi:hypothetical protein